MTTLLIGHPAFLDHDTGPGHPECADRLRAVDRALEAENFQHLARTQAKPAAPEQLRRVHPADFVDFVLAGIPKQGLAYVDGDTVASPGSREAALRAAGAVCQAVDEVCSGGARNAFCAVRPPGHHAEATQAMGFCLFNNVAVGALHARAAHGLKRVAVVDFDVHHGNGTQHSFERDPALFFASTHQWPLYPGTGRREEKGVGNVVNAPLAPFSDGSAFRAAFEREILPALDRFAPELVMVSAGFDAHADDPLAQLQLREADYGWVTRELLKLADRHAKGRLVSSLEGGYNLRALGASVATHVRELMAA
ncbi:MAG: histone deacetylase family protein [Alphaproteobacteria bacterium]|nr:histone deacetylase family protein [Alphaproteobacteria bacterium]